MIKSGAVWEILSIVSLVSIVVGCSMLSTSAGWISAGLAGLVVALTRDLGHNKPKRRTK